MYLFEIEVDTKRNSKKLFYRIAQNVDSFSATQKTVYFSHEICEWMMDFFLPIGKTKNLFQHTSRWVKPGLVVRFVVGEMVLE